MSRHYEGFVTRFRIEDEYGRVLTVDGFFTDETADAWEFSDEQDAIEECAWIIGATVERFQRYSETPDFTFGREDRSERSAA